MPHKLRILRALAGAGCMVAACAWIYPPLGLLAAGVFLLVLDGRS